MPTFQLFTGARPYANVAVHIVPLANDNKGGDGGESYKKISHKKSLEIISQITYFLPKLMDGDDFNGSSVVCFTALVINALDSSGCKGMKGIFGKNSSTQLPCLSNCLRLGKCHPVLCVNVESVCFDGNPCRQSLCLEALPKSDAFLGPFVWIPFFTKGIAQKPKKLNER